MFGLSYVSFPFCWVKFALTTWHPFCLPSISTVPLLRAQNFRRLPHWPHPTPTSGCSGMHGECLSWRGGKRTKRGWVPIRLCVQYHDPGNLVPSHNRLSRWETWLAKRSYLLCSSVWCHAYLVTFGRALWCRPAGVFLACAPGHLSFIQLIPVSGSSHTPAGYGRLEIDRRYGDG